MSKYKGEIGLIIVTLIWGFGFPITNIALNHADTFQIMAIRFTIASVILSLIYHKSFKKIDKINLIAGLVVGLSLFMACMTQTIGMMFTSTSKVAFLTTTNVVMVPIIAFVIDRHKLDKFSVFGAVIAFIGTAVLSFNMDFSVNIGDVLSLICAFGFAAQIFFTGYYLQKGADPYLITILQMIVTAVFSLISYFIAGAPSITGINNTGWLAIMYLAVISTPVTYLLQTVSQKYVTNQTRAVVILSMESVFGTAAAIIIIHDVLTPRMFLGCAIILAGVMCAEAGAQIINKFKFKGAKS